MPVHHIDNTIQSITATGPASISNLAVGFDLLGAALDKPEDRVTLRPRQDHHLVIRSVDHSAEFQNTQDTIPIQNRKNTATIGLRAFLNELNIKQGFDVFIQKGLTSCSGMGSSAASAVAAITACNQLLNKPLPRHALIPIAAKAEGVISGTRHADNVAPAILGGLVLCQPGFHAQSLPSPKGKLIIIKPERHIQTRAARALLPQSVTLQKSMQYTSRLANWLAAIHRGDTETAARFMVDDLIEVARKALWPHYPAIKRIALDLEAHAVFMSGSGPAVAVWCRHQHVTTIKSAIRAHLDKKRNHYHIWTSRWNAPGATVTEIIR